MTTSERSDYRSTPPIAHRNSPTDTRAAERFVPEWRETQLVAEHDKKLTARIVNMSALAVAIEADFSNLPPEAVVKIGKRTVKPGRKMMGGAVFLFDPPLPKRICGPTLIL